jgi:sugar/nucleoside kinase (ribokinase family)
MTDASSPNHVEALCLLSLTPETLLPADQYKALLTHACVRLARLRPRLGAVLRCGHLGCCYIHTRSLSLADGVADPGPEDVRWVPAFWDKSVPGSEGRVVDPTGAGNAFMGGLGAALHAGHDLHEGASHPP